MKRSSQYKVVSVLRDWSTIPSQEDLQVTLGCPDREASDIHWVATSDTYSRLITVMGDANQSMIMVTNMLEALHQSLDGWTEGDKMVIELFLCDLILAQDASIRT